MIRDRQKGSEDRTTGYSIWHRKNLAGYCAENDIDGIEWRIWGDEIKLVALIEKTVLEYLPKGKEMEASLLSGIIDRLYRKTRQADFLLMVAERLECRAFIVAFDRALTRFYVYDMHKENWSIFAPSEYKGFIENLSSKNFDINEYREFKKSWYADKERTEY